jgi:phage gp46-like protein
MTFTGDVLIKNIEGEFDIVYENGQPLMADGFESAIILAIFGDRNTWQNSLAETEEEKYISTFPEVVDRAMVNEKTKNDGTEALKAALNFLKSSGAASNVSVRGEIYSVFAIAWEIIIEAPTGGRYLVNWEKGKLALFKEAT